MKTWTNFVKKSLCKDLCNWSFIKRQASGTSSDNEWQRAVQRVVQRVTTSDTTIENEWNDNEWQRVIQQLTTSDNKRQHVVQLVTTIDYWWHQMTRSDNERQFWANFLFSNNMVLVWAVLHFITREVTAGSSNSCIQNLCKFITISVLLWYFLNFQPAICFLSWKCASSFSMKNRCSVLY